VDAVTEQLNQMEATLRELLRRSDTELAQQS
jgi:hypothetical protein